MVRPSIFAIAVIVGLVTAGCSGGTAPQSGASLPNVAMDGVRTVSDAADALDAHRASASQNAELAIGATDAFGSIVQSFNDEEEIATALHLSASAPSPAQKDGSCESGVASFAPDRNGDPNSDETLHFYDGRCRWIARDVVRHYAGAGPNDQTIRESVWLFPLGSSTPMAGRSETLKISSATFPASGRAPLRDGFRLIGSSRLSSAGKQIASNSEVVMLPGQGTVTDYCQASAGYSISGIPSLDETFGWQSAAFSGVARATDGQGFATWSATENGDTAQGPIGSLSIAQRAVNAACPMTASTFSLGGAAAKNAFSMPIILTFHRGTLLSLTVANAKMLDGETFDATTATGRQPSDRAYVSGTVKGSHAQIATFHTDAFGDGALTITSTGAQYIIADWIVIGT
jgi:hypothetical protein